MLTDLITGYLEAERIWQAQFDEDEDKAVNTAEWLAYMDAACRIVEFRCSSMEEISERAAFILSKEFLVDIIVSSTNDRGAKDFLASMVSPVATPNTEEGAR